jgi:peroxiredoxin
MDFHQLIVGEHCSSDAVVPIDLRCGTAFPEFLLPDDSGSLVWSRELTAQGPYALFYFHGGWCETCINRLRHLDAQRQQFYAMGVAVVAVSPDTGGSPRHLKQLHELSIPLLSDVDHALAKELDFAFSISRPLLSQLRASGIDLSERYGSRSGVLPASALFAIGRDGTLLAGSIEGSERFAQPEEFVGVFQEVTPTLLGPFSWRSGLTERGTDLSWTFV